jgi:AAA domain
VNPPGFCPADQWPEEKRGDAWEPAKQIANGQPVVDCVPPKQADRPRFNPTLYTDAAFMDAKFPLEWLVTDVFAKNYPGVFGGPKKTLKTNGLVDLVLSLGTGGKFLAEFDVPNPVKVLFMSGESGGAVLQETRNRIAASKGIDYAVENIIWSLDLPQLSSVDHLNDLANILEENRVEVMAIDPLYLCLLAGEDPEKAEASNYYKMGPLFQRISQTSLAVGCTPILAPHARKNIPFDRPLELDDLAFAGIGEFCRQWILLNRREPYRGDGKHALHLSIGGHAGQCFFGHLDIDEGRQASDFTGRRWDVEITTALEAKEAKAAEREQRQLEEDQADDLRISGFIDQFSKEPAKATLTRLRNLGGLSKKRCDCALERLVDTGNFRRWVGEATNAAGKKHQAEMYERVEETAGETA